MTQKNKLRIIAGDWKSRHIVFSNSPALRPTPARVRETLFNWLCNDIVTSRCLDLYAGSGALGFEAASRGAKFVTMVEKNPKVCQLIKKNIDKLLAKQIRLVQSDVINFLTINSTPFDIVFLDPPFVTNKIYQTCQYLLAKSWLAPKAKIYVEVGSNMVLDNMPTNWQCLHSKKAGNVSYNLFMLSTN